MMLSGATLSAISPATMIGDAAFREKCILVTDDKKFIKNYMRMKLKQLHFENFVKLLVKSYKKIQIIVKGNSKKLYKEGTPIFV